MMKKTLLGISLFFMNVLVFAQVNSTQSFLDEISGVYKVRFPNGLVSGEKFTSENILEIVPVNDHAAYIRMELEFYNGHKGGISGIAEQRNSSLVYLNKEKNCLVNFNFTKDMVITHADYNKYPECSNYHGARGTLDNIQFPRKNKRTIRYMTRLKNSTEFKNAMEEYKISVDK